MSSVVSLDKARKKAKEARKKGLCQHNIHRWAVCKKKAFDSRQGKLVTVYRCTRCGKEKVKAH